MNIVCTESNEELIRWAESLGDIMKERGRQDLFQGIDAQIQDFRKNTFTIAVIGKAKRGKSTLINVLMERHDDTLAPIDKLPVSSTITCFQWAEAPAAEVSFKSGESRTITWEQVRQYVTEESNPNNAKGVSVVSVKGPIDGLMNGVELVDTPGAGSIHEYHDAILHAFIPQADAVIFIATAQMPFDQDELDLLAHVKTADVPKIFFVINRIDEIDEEEDLQEAIQHNTALLSQVGICCETMYQISAKLAYQGKPDSGVETLVDALRDFISRERLSILQKRFIVRICELIETEVQTLAVQLASLRKTDEELAEEIAFLQSEYSRMNQYRGGKEQEFEMAWNNAVNQLQQQLASAEHTVHDQIQAECQSCPISELSNLARALPTNVASSIEKAVQPFVRQFESRAQELCQELQSSYPAIGFAQNGRLILRSGTDVGAISAGLGGAVTAAAGLTFVYAGSTAASGLAASAAAPLWVALSGPVGWTIAGLGALVIPLAWAISGSKRKDSILEAADRKITEIFTAMRQERIPELREMGRSIIISFKNRLEVKKTELERAMEGIRQKRPSEAEIQKLERQDQEVQTLMAKVESYGV